MLRFVYFDLTDSALRALKSITANCFVIMVNPIPVCYKIYPLLALASDYAYAISVQSEGGKNGTALKF